MDCNKEKKSTGIWQGFTQLELGHSHQMLELQEQMGGAFICQAFSFYAYQVSKKTKKGIGFVSVIYI